jgi:serine/threonine-protein kinase PpkA
VFLNSSPLQNQVSRKCAGYPPIPFPADAANDHYRRHDNDNSESRMKIPGYQIEGEIGHGGMATVYQAVQTSLERTVALKVMAPALAADTTFGERFQKEAKTVASLTHPNILAIHDIGAVGPYNYIAMEYVSGGDLKECIRKGLTPEQALEVVRQVADALEHAHKQGIVHRDIKPENILFREDGTVVLTDFGIAKSVDATTQMTATGMSIGTPRYMSPEQAQGKSGLDGRSDLYSLGVVLFEALTGKAPFDAETPVGIALKHVQAEIPKLPAQLAKYQPLIDRLMAKTPTDRYNTGSQLIADITRVQSGKKLPRPADARQRKEKPKPGGLKWVALALVLGSSPQRESTWPRKRLNARLHPFQQIVERNRGLPFHSPRALPTSPHPRSPQQPLHR